MAQRLKKQAIKTKFTDGKRSNMQIIIVAMNITLEHFVNSIFIINPHIPFYYTHFQLSLQVLKYLLSCTKNKIFFRKPLLIDN